MATREDNDNSKRHHIDVQVRIGLALSAAPIVLGRHGCVAVQYKQVPSTSTVGRFHRPSNLHGHACVL